MLPEFAGIFTEIATMNKEMNNDIVILGMCSEGKT